METGPEVAPRFAVVVLVAAPSPLAMPAWSHSGFGLVLFFGIVSIFFPLVTSVTGAPDGTPSDFLRDA